MPSPSPACIVPDCARHVKAAGLCNVHHDACRRTIAWMGASPLTPSMISARDRLTAATWPRRHGHEPWAVAPVGGSDGYQWDVYKVGTHKPSVLDTAGGKRWGLHRVAAGPPFSYHAYLSDARDAWMSAVKADAMPVSKPAATHVEDSEQAAPELSQPVVEVADRDAPAEALGNRVEIIRQIRTTLDAYAPGDGTLPERVERMAREFADVRREANRKIDEAQVAVAKADLRAESLVLTEEDLERRYADLVRARALRERALGGRLAVGGGAS